MELLIFKTSKEDRRKNQFQIPEEEETEHSALASLIRSEFMISLFTGSDMYETFERMEKEESLTNERYLMVLLSNALQKANMSSSAYRVNLAELIEELLDLKDNDVYSFSDKSDFDKVCEVYGKLVKSYLKFEAKYVDGDDESGGSDGDGSESDDCDDDVEKDVEARKGDDGDFKVKVFQSLKAYQENLRSLVPMSRLLQFLSYKGEKEAGIVKAREQVEEIIRVLYFKSDKAVPLYSNNLLQMYIGFPFLYFTDPSVVNFSKIVKESKEITPEEDEEQSDIIQDLWKTYQDLRRCFKLLAKFIKLASSYSVSGIQSSRRSDPDLKEMTTYCTPYLKWMNTPFNETYSISVVSLFGNLGQNLEVIDVRVTDGRDVKYFEDVKLSKLDSSQGFNVFDLIKRITSMDKRDNHGMFDSKFYLPSVCIDESIRTLLIDERKGYNLKDFDFVDFHRITSYSVYDEIKLGKVGALFIDLLDEDENVLRTLNCVLDRNRTLNEQLSIIHELFVTYSLNLKSSYIKKNMSFDGDTIGWFNKFGDYLDIVKGFDEKPCSPVFQIVLKDVIRRRLKGYKFKKSKETGIGRIGIDQMLQKNIDLSEQQLRKLGFANTNFDSTFLVVEAQACSTMVSFSPEVVIGYKKNFSGKQLIEENDDSSMDESKDEDEESKETGGEEGEEEDEESEEDNDSESNEDEGVGTEILYSMIAFLVEEEEARLLYFFDKGKKKFVRSDGLDVKTVEEFKGMDIVIGYYEKKETL